MYELTNDAGITYKSCSLDLAKLCESIGLKYHGVNFHIKHKIECVYKNYHIKKGYIYSHIFEDDRVFIDCMEK